MEAAREFPSQDYAVYRGVRYLVGSDEQGRLTLRDEVSGLPVLAPPIEALDGWYHVQTVGTFIGERFFVHAEYSDGTLWISFDEGNGIKIASEWRERSSMGSGGDYWQEDRFTFCARVPKEEVTGIHEERRDVLVEWRERNKGQG